MIKALLYIRGVFLALFFAIHTLYCSVIVITLLLLRFPRRIVDIAVGPLWCGTMVRLSGMIPEVRGEENVPRDKGCLFLFTHASHMDIPLLFHCSPKSFRFGAKISLFKIPLFGPAMRMAGTLPIARENRSQVMEVYREAEARVAAGEAFALAPEGTRRVGDRIKDFKSGPFFFAINAKMPIVPVVMCGVDRILSKKSIAINPDRWSRKVGVHFLPAIETKDIPIEDVRKLRDEVRDLMVAEYEQMKPLYL
jgi:1-acyl-sn-glycerol-3-phosphate acyltransferase